MRGVAVSVRSLVAAAVGAAALVLAAGPAAAFETWDGRVQAHGFGEIQVRAISEDFADELDLTQWYNVFNLELEVDLLERPIGPVDLMSLFVRAEVRYDCVWTRACGIFPTANVYGDRADMLPRDRLANGQETTTNGAILVGPPELTLPLQEPGDPSEVGPFAIFADINPDSFDFVFQRFLDFRFASIASRRGDDFGTDDRLLGPWLPKNFIHANAALADIPNPFDASLVFAPGTANPLLGNPGAGALPFRPIPVAVPGSPFAAAPPARGIYIPSQADRQEILSGGFEDIGHKFNFRQAELEWNRGDSQQQTKELKEAYLDIELFDAQLWLRLGRQSIVWGKTELFRTTDQFNPTDLALASLPSLEESRIPLWSARAVLSLWNHPFPVEDLRFELAANIDEYQGTDLGSCGEPYTPNPVCDLTVGIWAHGITGIGIMGIDEPEDPWDDLSGLEIGGRVEFRWDRFSFAIMDFWGYEDTPYVRRVTTYNRNVDPNSPHPSVVYPVGHPLAGQPYVGTGAPRILDGLGPCVAQLQPLGGTMAYVRQGADCLQPGPTQRTTALPGGMNPVFFDATGAPRPALGPSQADVPNNALDFHHANNQVFTLICSTTIGFTTLDPRSCALNIFGSPALQAGIIPTGTIISGVLAGFPGINGLFSGPAGLDIVGLPIVALTDDDALLGGPGNAREVVPTAAVRSPEGASLFLGIFGPAGTNGGLSGQLTPEQEALLGCGPLWLTNCDDDGIDLLNADASALLQSFIGFEGTGPSANVQIPLGATMPLPPGSPSVGAPQPGHVGFQGGPVCTTGDISRGATNAPLPGCRPVGSPLYAQVVDGSVAGIGYIPAGTTATDGFLPYQGPGAQNPLHGQTFQSEMAAVSWNFMMLLVANSTPDPADPSTFSESFLGQNTGNAAADLARAFSTTPGQCSYLQPQFCSVVQSIWAVTGLTRNTVEAGGNYKFGRRTFQWHAGGDGILEFEKRNVLGLSVDFAEDRTKTNWSIEFTWIEDRIFTDNSQFDGISTSDEFNLTISADRPTFVNFLNANRTFFINTQWFFQYRPGYNKGYTTNGPYNVLATVAVQTGYFQDRLLPSFVVVWDFGSSSGAFLPQIGYRFSEAFSLTIGAALFNGREEFRDMPVNPLSLDNQQGENAYQVSVENGLAAVRDRDEIFFRLRYTF